MSITAKVKVQYTSPNGEDQTQVNLIADYDDDRNKEWAKYTPALSVAITVKNEIADRFPMGQAFTLNFTPED